MSQRGQPFRIVHVRPVRIHVRKIRDVLDYLRSRQRRARRDRAWWHEQIYKRAPAHQQGKLMWE